MIFLKSRKVFGKSKMDILKCPKSKNPGTFGEGFSLFFFKPLG